MLPYSELNFEKYHSTRSIISHIEKKFISKQLYHICWFWHEICCLAKHCRTESDNNTKATQIYKTLVRHKRILWNEHRSRLTLHMKNKLSKDCGIFVVLFFNIPLQSPTAEANYSIRILLITGTYIFTQIFLLRLCQPSKQ